jgi:hypothetical protein
MFAKHAKKLAEGTSDKEKNNTLAILTTEAFGNATNSLAMAQDEHLLKALLQCLLSSSSDLHLGALSALNNIACNCRAGRALVAAACDGKLLSAIASFLTATPAANDQIPSKAIGTISFLSHDESAASHMHGFVDLLYVVRRGGKDADSALAVMAIANILGREERSKLVADHEVLSIVVDLLKASLDGSTYAQLCWVPEYVLPPLVSLSISDSNKKELAKLDTVALLVKVLVDTSYQTRYPKLVDVNASQELALDALAHLSFNQTALDQLTAIESKSKVVSRFTTHGSSAIQTKAARVLWMLELESPPEVTVATPSEEGQATHIMLSYSWKQKNLRKVAADMQKRGYRVWLDVEQMSGSTVQGDPLSCFCARIPHILARYECS